MRKPFKKSVSDIPLEWAHGWSGSRKLLLSSQDEISWNLEAMTQGFLPVWSIFDWHFHEGVDEFFLVTHDVWNIEFRDTLFSYEPGEIIYIPADTEHRIIAGWNVENQFYFIRVKNPNANT
jgi:mannose-6-phosphate isomerase-like protein (cupin superfamily)